MSKTFIRLIIASAYFFLAMFLLYNIGEFVSITYLDGNPDMYGAILIGFFVLVVLAILVLIILLVFYGCYELAKQVC